MTYISVQQINGDLRIDDEEEDAPMLKLEFFDKFATELSDEEKQECLGAVSRKLTEIFTAKNGPDKDCDRRGAINATRAKSAE